MSVCESDITFRQRSFSTGIDFEIRRMLESFMQYNLELTLFDCLNLIFLSNLDFFNDLFCFV